MIEYVATTMSTVLFCSIVSRVSTVVCATWVSLLTSVPPVM